MSKLPYCMKMCKFLGSLFCKAVCLILVFYYLTVQFEHNCDTWEYVCVCIQGMWLHVIPEITRRKALSLMKLQGWYGMVVLHVEPNIMLSNSSDAIKNTITGLTLVHLRKGCFVIVCNCLSLDQIVSIFQEWIPIICIFLLTEISEHRVGLKHTIF